MKPMKSKAFAWLLALMLVLPCIAFSPPAARAAASGEWVLVEVEDESSENYEHSTDDVHVRLTYGYARSDFTIDWFGREQGYDTTIERQGTVRALFGAMPERIRPGETVSLSVSLSASYSGDAQGASGGDTVTAQAILSGRAITQGNIKNEYAIALGSPSQTSDTIVFSLPEGNAEMMAMSLDDFVYFDFFLGGGVLGHLATGYTYKWVPAEAAEPTPTPAPAGGIELRGLVRSVENKPMPWMKLEAHVYWEKERYEGGQPDATIESATDHEGRYSMTISPPEGHEGPVGILLIGTLKCVYPYEGGKDPFYFVDMADSFSTDNERISLSTWISVDPADYPDVPPGEPIPVYRLLAFYNLGLDAWSFDERPGSFEPDPLYHFGQDPRQGELLQNYSTLYTAAFDAWFFGAIVLEEENSLTGKDLRIEVRWPVTEQVSSSHYDLAGHCVRLEATDSLRDELSRFTILHEFGHAFDTITNGTIYRAYEPRGPGNVNHGGYMNDTTADSYMEGFATFYAGAVQLYGGYPNPQSVAWIDLGGSGRYTAWGNGGKSEELAIASLLYNTIYLIGEIRDYWSILDPDRPNFYEYYTAIEAHLTQQSPQKARSLRRWAIDSGLHLMPHGGNGMYDPGEPFRDLDGGNDNRWDPGEPYADLMFDVDENDAVDFSKPLREYDEADLTAGQSSDAARARKTIEPPLSGFLYLSGESAEYLLVDILPDGEPGSRTLRAVKEGKVLIGLPDKMLTGTVRVSVPGGGVVYEGDLAALQYRQAQNAGRAVPLGEAIVSAAHLAAPGTSAIATYGSAGASGVLTIPKMSHDELMRLSDGYDGSADIETVAAALAARKANGPVPPPSDAPRQSGGRKTAGYVAAGIALLLTAALAALLFVRAKRVAAPSPGVQPGAMDAAYVCPSCGAMVRESAKFCAGCGSPAPAAAPQAPAACPLCGALVAPGKAFCANCGTPQPPRPSAAAQYAPPPQTPAVALIAGVAAAAMLSIGASAYFLFFAQASKPQPPRPSPTAPVPTAPPASATATPAPSVPSPTPAAPYEGAALLEFLQGEWLSDVDVDGTCFVMRVYDDMFATGVAYPLSEGATHADWPSAEHWGMEDWYWFSCAARGNAIAMEDGLSSAFEYWVYAQGDDAIQLSLKDKDDPEWAQDQLIPMRRVRTKSQRDAGMYLEGAWISSIPFDEESGSYISLGFRRDGACVLSIAKCVAGAADPFDRWIDNWQFEEYRVYDYAPAKDGFTVVYEGEADEYKVFIHDFASANFTHMGSDEDILYYRLVW